MNVLFYRGTSIVSTVIRWQTRSRYSHVAMQNGDSVIEAWHIGGVRLTKSPFESHTNGTVIDVCMFDFGGHIEQKMWNWLLAQVGKRYDFRMVLRFLPRLKETEESKDKYFCSELCMAASVVGGLPFLSRVSPAYVAPGHLWWSPFLTYVYTIKEGKGKVYDEQVFKE